MNDALIGHTGFVGSNLLRASPHMQVYNSRNIESMIGGSFGHVVCAGVSAAKWLANSNPENDLAQIRILQRVLRTIECKRFSLISTVDVYRDPSGVDECSAIETIGLHAYGTHRFLLEEFVREQFPAHTVVRLPALFGPNLKKNALYDLIHDNNVDALDARAQFQWYDVTRLWSDLSLAVENHIALLNITSPPISLLEVQREFFPSRKVFDGINPSVARYDVKTLHASVFGGHQGYLYDIDFVLDSMRAYVASETQ